MFLKGTRLRNAKVINYFYFQKQFCFMVRSVSKLKHFQINGLKINGCHFLYIVIMRSSFSCLSDTRSHSLLLYHIYSIIHSFNKWLLSTKTVPDTVLDLGDARMNRGSKGPQVSENVVRTAS